MLAANDDLLQEAIRHATYLERFKSHLVSKLIALLNRSDQDLINQILKRDPTAVTGAWTTKRLTKLLDELRGINQEAYKSLGKELIDQLDPLALHEYQWQQKAIQAATPVKLTIVAPAPDQLYAAVMARPFQGRLLKEYLKGIEDKRAARVRDAIRMGVVQGQTIDQIVRRIRGTRSQQYRDGLLEIDRKNAATVVQTAVNHTANVAREQLYGHNADIIKGIEWVSTLDGRTCLECAGLDNQVFKMGKGPRPPAHMRCRCTTTPVLKSWRELGLNIDNAPPGTRASMNGQVPATHSYGDWLKSQPRHFVEDTLGPTRAKLFLDGNLRIDKFTNRAGDDLTLQQLQHRDKAVFERAGIAQ